MGVKMKCKGKNKDGSECRRVALFGGSKNDKTNK